jgi:predicted dehydrogenase
VASVYASSQRRALPADIDMDDTTAMLLKFARGASGTVSTVFVSGDYWRLQVLGSKGWLELRNDTELTARGLSGAPQRIQLETVDKERLELEAFADAIAAGRRLVVPREDIVTGVSVLESIEKSSAKGRRIDIESVG